MQSEKREGEKEEHSKNALSCFCLKRQGDGNAIHWDERKVRFSRF